MFPHLFDWNKKNLSSNKLLPPAAAKQAKNKFGGNEKPTKLRLIADENNGGFPDVMKNGTRGVHFEQKDEIRTPGLVARLMGLESVPADTSSSEFRVDRVKESVNYSREFSKDDKDFGKMGIKQEWRPQKVQKTGSYENVRLRSTKHLANLASPVKSPKSLSSRNAPHLIGAATKILEPGLQSRNRAKLVVTYSKALHYVTIDETMLEATAALSPAVSKCSNYYVSEAKSMKGRSYYGNLLDTVNVRPNIEEVPSVFTSSVSNYAIPSHQEPERSTTRSPIPSIEQEKERLFQKGQKHFASLGAQATDNVRPHPAPISDKMPLDRENQSQWHLTSQKVKLQKDSPPCICLKHKTQIQNPVSRCRDVIPPGSKLGNPWSNVALTTNVINHTEDFVAFNPSLSGQTRLRMPASVDNYILDSERKFCNRHDDSLSPVRKRRSMNNSRQCENSTCIKSRLAHLRQSKRTNSGENDVISFTFSSPMKHNSGVPYEIMNRRPQIDSTCKDTPQRNSIFDENDGNVYFQKSFPLKGDTLGALLEQKWKELACHEEDELAPGGSPPTRTSAMILQELISALTAERPYTQDDATVRYNREDISCSHGDMSSTDTDNAFQPTSMTAGAPIRYSRDSDHLNSGSVHQASFSNKSFFSRSSDDISEYKSLPVSMDCSYDESQPLQPNEDHLYSAASLNNGKSDRELVTDLHNHISETLCSIDLAGTRLKGGKLTHAKDVILNAELVLHNAYGTKGFSISRFLLDEMERLASVIWTNFSYFLGLQDAKEGNLVTSFLFEAVVEYLESRYGQFCKYRPNMRAKLSLHMNDDMLIREVVEEVGRWASLDGLILDELIEREMSCWLGKWTDFEIEAFETGVEIDGDILQILIDEVVVDLLECRKTRRYSFTT